jgi:hypothetical protein
MPTRAALAVFRPGQLLVRSLLPHRLFPRLLLQMPYGTLWLLSLFPPTRMSSRLLLQERWRAPRVLQVLVNHSVSRDEDTRLGMVAVKATHRAVLASWRKLGPVVETS